MSENYLDDIDLIEKMAQSSVLVVGDIMLDRFVYGRVERISPESPVPILSITRENKMLGGAGNTLSNLIHLKCKGKILSIIGDDEDGATVKKLAQEMGIDIQGLITVSDRPTIVKTRFLAGHQQLLRTDFERIQAISPALEKQLFEKADQLIKDVKAVIISDYGKGLLSTALIQHVIKTANQLKIPTLVDPKGRDYSIYAGATAVTPNKKELSEATEGMRVETDEEIITAAQKLMKTSGVKAVIATRSKDGMSVIQGSEPVHIRSASDIEVFDVSGAGDTVIATIAGCLAAGADLVQAAAIANVAGSIVVAKVGTAPIRSEELMSVLENHDPQADLVKASNNKQPRVERVRQAPILSWDEAKEEVQRWRARGLNIGFTNGCFDILHFGHVSYLNEARKRCERLVVGLNCDTSVKILKGPERPVHDENARAAVLAALGCVDMVVLFGAEQQGQDNTACALLQMLQPDVYFKGGDYEISQIPEAPTVIKYGGRVDVMPSYEGHSTTSSIAKMKNPQAA